SFSNALKGNKQLGLLVKRLRVEGGYGPLMHTVLQFAPNIIDIFLSFDLQSSDNTSGLCKGLDLINPARLILWHDSSKFRGKKMISQLLDSLSRAIPN
ncbi:hypothetical protein R3P38DRAFT_2517116, partial [Favolaschia claudopus]